MSKVFAIYDSKAECSTFQFFAINAGLAVRKFEDLVRDPNLPFGKYPEDFSLHEVGEFDERTMVIKEQQHVNLGLAAGFVAQQKNEELRLVGEK